MVERTGDPFRTFYGRVLPEVYGYLHTRLSDPDRAEVATREAFEAIILEWPLPANVEHEVAFARDFARRRLTDEYRRQDQQVKRRRRYAAMRSSAAAHRTTAAPELRVHWAMAALPPRQRAAMVLRHVDGLDVREVAAILGLGSQLAEILLLRGSRTLHQALKQAKQTDGFDPLSAMKDLDGPVAPPEEFREELYDHLRELLDRLAVGAPRSVEPPRPVVPKVFLIAAAGLAAVLVLAGILTGSGDFAEQPPNTVEPLPLSEPDRPEHNPDPAVISPATSQSPAFEPIRPPTQSLGGYEFGGWTVLPVSEFDGRRGAAVTWTGEQLFVWGGEISGSIAERTGILAPGADIWFSVPPAPIPVRSGATALWTGSEVLILGGGSRETAAYHPVSRQWRELPPAPLPLDGVAVWTGTEALLFGGSGRSGLALNVADATWRALADAPDLDWENVGGVWTGTELIVWGELATVDMAAYDPAEDSWRRFAQLDDGLPLMATTGVWTGEEVILWGIDGRSHPAHAGLALNPATDEWRLIARPRSTAIEFFWGPTSDVVVWTGNRMLVWPSGRYERTRDQEIWAYDPVADVWERGASSPIASNPDLIWTGDTLYAYGGGDRLQRTLRLDLGPSGADLPEPVGTEVVVSTNPPLPFELLAVAADSRRAAVIDLAGGIATVYEPSENLLPPDPLDGATPAGSGWVTSADGAVWAYPNGIASQPFVLQGELTVERPGFAPSIYVLPARGDLYSGWIWIVEPGTGGSADPSLVSQVSLDNGRKITTASVAGSAYPVASTAAGLLLNVDGHWGPEMNLVTLDGSVRELWSGWGLGLSALGRVTWLECDEGLDGCRIVVSVLDGRDPDDLVIEGPGFGAVFQPGVSQVSPDGAWLVTIMRGAVDPDSPPSVVLVNLRDGSVTELFPSSPLGSGPGPGVVWSADGEWVVVAAAGPAAIRIADGLVVELAEWIPADMEVYAVASR